MINLLDISTAPIDGTRFIIVDKFKGVNIAMGDTEVAGCFRRFEELAEDYNPRDWAIFFSPFDPNEEFLFPLGWQPLLDGGKL